MTQQMQVDYYNGCFRHFYESQIRRLQHSSNAVCLCCCCCYCCSPYSMLNPSFPAEAWIHKPAVEVQSLSCWTTREVPKYMRNTKWIWLRHNLKIQYLGNIQFNTCLSFLLFLKNHLWFTALSDKIIANERKEAKWLVKVGEGMALKKNYLIK